LYPEFNLFDCDRRTCVKRRSFAAKSTSPESVCSSARTNAPSKVVCRYPRLRATEVKGRSLLAAELQDASTGPVAPPPAQILQAQQNSLTPDPLTIAFAGSFVLAGISLFANQALADDQIDSDSTQVDPRLREWDASVKDRNAPTVRRAWRKAQCSSWCELVESASLSRGVTCHSEFESG
jgi:hypothetical protein